MIDDTQEKISFSGTVISVQPRSNVWRYKLDNRTHSMTGYNIFISGETAGEQRNFAVAISEKQQMKIQKTGRENALPVNGRAWQMSLLSIIGALHRNSVLKAFVMAPRTAHFTRWADQEQFHTKTWTQTTIQAGLMTYVRRDAEMMNKHTIYCSFLP